jgi:RHS repeat-associated protein
VQASRLYAPYGSLRYSQGTMPTDYGFTGQRNDATTGLQYYGSRFYDPQAAQFVSADTVLPGGGYDPLGLSRYAYVEGNPVIRTDPSGHAWWSGIVNSVHHWVSHAVSTVRSWVSGAVSWVSGVVASWHPVVAAVVSQARAIMRRATAWRRPARSRAPARRSARPAAQRRKPSMQITRARPAAHPTSHRDIPHALLAFQGAELKSAALNGESLVGFSPYAMYYGAYRINQAAPNSRVPGLNGAMSWLQRRGLHADEAWDRIELRSGYPGASARDERIRVSPIPSVIYPTMSGGQWQQSKWTQPWIGTAGPGLGPTGGEDYAD